MANESSENIEGSVDGQGNVIPPESEEAKKNRIAEEKAKLDRQLAAGEIDGIEYNRKLIDLRVFEKPKPKPLKVRRTGVLITFFAILIISSIPATIYLNWRFYFQNSLLATGVPDYSKELVSSIEDDPIQINLDGHTESGKYKGRSINITYKAYYDITGVVVSVRDYWGFDAYDTLVPRDVCMVWGELVDAYNERGVNFSQGKRNCRPILNGVELDDINISKAKGKWGNTVFSLRNFSNNHIIPSTAEIRNQVFGLGAGSKVRLTGYLVSVNFDRIMLSSSLSRDDIGNGACEVFYVTGVEKL